MANTKKGSNNKSSSNSGKLRSNEIAVDKNLAKNLASLQEVMADVSSKLNNLTNQVSNLLDLFEDSAKALARKEIDSSQMNKSQKELLDKLDEVYEQNDAIVRSLNVVTEGNVLSGSVTGNSQDKTPGVKQITGPSQPPITSQNQGPGPTGGIPQGSQPPQQGMQTTQPQTQQSAQPPQNQSQNNLQPSPDTQSDNTTNPKPPASQEPQTKRLPKLP